MFKWKNAYIKDLNALRLLRICFYEFIYRYVKEGEVTNAYYMYGNT